MKAVDMDKCCKSCHTHPCPFEKYNPVREETAGARAGALIVLLPLAIIMSLIIVCAVRADEYRDLAGIMAEADAKLEYRHYVWYQRPKDAAPNEQNCVGFSGFYTGRAIKAGYTPEQILCTIPQTGEGHMYVRVNRWALDNRYKAPISINNQDCK